MDSVTTLTACPSVPSTVWAVPRSRAALDTFFRGFGFTTEADLSALAAWVLDGYGAQGAQPPAAVALARARMETWFASVLGMEHAGPGLLARGRAAFVLCDGANRGARLLTRASAPEDFVKAARAAVPVPAPAQVSAVMPEQQLVLWPFGELLRRWWRGVSPDVSISR
ncbi:hypothetical protein HUA74_29765 [Myxococcus sp. CA051A]|uniref:Uncharacterized protein n=1 Tax=Myxococcus llanfairpwllgwyngyllgogerychwyrndrobwllllantysiliogogogochensis TaxID=2590453 RepID=A0A540X4X1_9BACT|nr:hypothetical protein [Myxococcus sp. CA040A]NTX50105.1 hypothetical protein [Myxococcus sp. CA039A]NTX64848.1 hypothetical protein [Myxococcus sp. CA051A]TQF15764.1 hypothetical protein FJV41_11850 [Myxococcus llanfairpwllgwyngyllgogerychwyrndrobwllllantysiliogogogochensis]